MDSRDQNAISDLFRKLHDVERQAGPRDAEAERLIADEARKLPGAPYYMAQTIVMQDMALNAKQQEVDDLRQQLHEAGQAGARAPAEGGGFLSRMFGGSGTPAPFPQRPAEPAAAAGPWGGAPQAARQPYPQQGYAPPPYPQQGGGFGRGGFLAGAAQTAMGVAGGVVLANAVGSMFGGGHGGLFGGGEQPTEVVNETTNIYEGDASDRRDVSDPGSPQDDAGYGDASFDDPGFDDGSGGYDDA